MYIIFDFAANSIMWKIMQNFGGKKCKIAIFGENLLSMKILMSFHCTCDLHLDNSRKATKHFEFKGIWSCYKF